MHLDLRDDETVTEHYDLDRQCMVYTYGASRESCMAIPAREFGDTEAIEQRVKRFVENCRQYEQRRADP